MSALRAIVRHSLLEPLLCLIGRHRPRPCLLNAKFDVCERCGRRSRVV